MISKYHIQYYDTITTLNINLSVVLFRIGTQTLCGQIELAKQDANLTFYVSGLKPRPNDLKIPYLVLRYDHNTEYKFIGRSLSTSYPNPLRPNLTSKKGCKFNLLRTNIQNPDQTISKCNIQYSHAMTTPNINLQVVLFRLST